MSFSVDINDPNVCIKCKSRDGCRMYAIEALAFENNHQDNCPHKWYMCASASDQKLLDVNEMLIAGIPHGTLIVKVIKDKLALNTSEKALREALMLLNKSLECDSSEYETARVYRLIGEIHLKLNDKQGALKSFHRALGFDSQVGVKRFISKLEKELALKE